MKENEMFGENEVTENYMEHTKGNMSKSHHRLTYSAISKSVAMFIIALWQVLFIKHVLENKDIVKLSCTRVPCGIIIIQKNNK
jgi:hypothetical protein